MKTYTYDEFIDELERAGFKKREDGVSWAGPHEDGTPIVGSESIKEICRAFPVASGHVLKLLLKGFQAEVEVRTVGYELRLTAKPGLVKVRDDPPTFARPELPEEIEQPKEEEEA